MKVLSHEDDVLKDGYGAELAAIKREYYRICVGLGGRPDEGGRTGVAGELPGEQACQRAHRGDGACSA